MSRTFSLLIGLVLALLAFFMFWNHYSSDEKSVENASTNQVNAKDWREFMSVAGNFRVKLPSLPQHISDNITNPKTQELRRYETFIAADDDGEAFMISVITFTHNVEDEKEDESVKAVVNDMLVRNKLNKLNELKPGFVKGMYGFDFSISNGDRLIIGKVFAKGNTVYLLSMINKSNAFNSQDFDVFVDSFEVIDAKGKISTPFKS